MTSSLTSPSRNLLILVLTPDNPCNTTITNQETDEILYTVTTEHDSKKSTTYLKDSSGSTTIASWEWREVRSDVLKIGESDPIPSSAWLNKSIIPFVDTVTFKDDSGRQFKWKGFSGGSQLELYSSDNKKNPMAAFSKSLKYTNRKVTPHVTEFRPATLTLDYRGQEITNLVVISFLMLEKKRRISETSSQSVADSHAAQTPDVRKLL